MAPLRRLHRERCGAAHAPFRRIERPRPCGGDHPRHAEAAGAMIIAVTGSSGLLGHAVAEALMAAGHRVTGIDTVPPTTALTASLAVDMTDLGETVLALR